MSEIISRMDLWEQALALTATVTLVLALIGFIMGRLRHIVIEGALARLLGTRVAIFVGYYLTIIGTLHHELAHALGYLLTGGRVHRISILPKSQPDGSVRLGYVTSSTRGPRLLQAVQNTICATAPLLFGFLTVYLLWRLALPAAADIRMRAFLYYAMASILLHMELSKADLKLLARGLAPSLLLLYLCIALALRIGR